MIIDNKASPEDNAIRIVDIMEQLDYGEKVRFMTGVIKGMLKAVLDTSLDKKVLKNENIK